MKRSSLASKPPPPRPVRQMDYQPRPRETVVVPLRERMVAPAPKVEPWRSEPYRRYQAAKPCMACGISGLGQAAHPNLGKGMGTKTDDRLVFSLCGPSPMRVGCHTAHDLCIDMTRDERREREAGYVARAQAEARRDGWPV